MSDNIETRVPGKFEYDVVVVGSGPGGYTAAFRAADLGLRRSEEHTSELQSR